jgi:hypothetical protein
MSDTPETDSLCTEHPKGTSAYIMELIDLCRKMERERNEAAQAESKLDALVEHHTRMIITHAKEVDSLLWVLETIKDVIGCGCGGDYGLCDDCSEAYKKADELAEARKTT